VQANSVVYDKYACKSWDDSVALYARNCSASFISDAQWGNSTVTLDPPYLFEDYYFPASSAGNSSIANWDVPGISTQAPEYAFYTQYHPAGSNG